MVSAQEGILSAPGPGGDSIDREIRGYLNSREIKSVLTPGEFSVFPLKLKENQVVVAEAWSDDFDPGLEIVDDKSKVMAHNDDRWPGDQSPLLFWRCQTAGDYELHIRCYHDKTGGPFFVRFNVYDSIDLGGGDKVETEVDNHKPLLFRVPMQAGQIKTVQNEIGGDHNYMPLDFNRVIAPGGMPDLNLSEPIRPICGDYVLFAPATGDYYFMETPNAQDRGKGKIRVWASEVVARTLLPEGSSRVGSASTRNAAVWELDLKKGDLIHATATGLDRKCSFVVAEIPDISKVDLSKPDKNPFIPRPGHPLFDPGQAFDSLPAREGDVREFVVQARRDVHLWIGSNGDGPNDKQYSVTVAPAASDLADGRSSSGKLRVAATDYWSFDAQPGNVLSLRSGTSGFTGTVIVRDPDLNEIRHSDGDIDETSQDWRMVATKPGRYLVAVSCLGNGGSGSYSLERHVVPAQPFDATHPAKGAIKDGEIQVWKFNTTPDKPVFVHWTSSNWDYDVNIYDDKGNPADFQRQPTDQHNRYGLLKVSSPLTYLIVLTGNQKPGSYAISLGPIPGLAQ